jgi:hypothetical protein
MMSHLIIWMIHLSEIKNYNAVLADLIGIDLLIIPLNFDASATDLLISDITDEPLLYVIKIEVELCSILIRSRIGLLLFFTNVIISSYMIIVCSGFCITM